MLDRFLFRRIDNSSLIVFRVIFGLLIFLEAIGAIFTGWVKRTMIEPEFTFSFIGFEWLQPLPGNWMYLFYVVMGIFGFMVMIGYKYRFSIIAYTVMWSATYFMQKSSYNNHYYLLIILCAIMAIQPANRYLSVDAKQNPSMAKYSMPNWSRWIFIIQMWIVYTYASVAKIYPDWLSTSVPEILMKSKQHYWLIGDTLQQSWVHYGIAYGGILYDGLIIPLLLFKPTRRIAFFSSIFFHMFNSFVFQVGIFPYMSLGFCVFFFSAETIHKLFLNRKPFYTKDEVLVPNYSKAFVAVLAVHFAIQVALPVRHWFFQDNVLWTEEAHRLSWRMMLRSRYGTATFNVVNKENNNATFVKLDDYLTKKQKRLVKARPDFIWQFAQRLKKEYAEKGEDVAVYVNCRVKVNGRRFQPLIDPKVDLAAEKWHPFKHHDWILPSNLDEKKTTNP